MIDGVKEGEFNLLSMSHKRIVVTGANRGIGKEICRQLVDQGHEVILAARSKEKGEQAAKEVGAHFMELDVADANNISSFIEHFEDKYNHLDVLVNNAGVFSDKDKRATNPDFKDIRNTLETNLLGPWQLSVGLFEALKKSKDPRIINVSSGLGAMSEMGGSYPAYRLSKLGINAMTRMMHSELEEGITINTMCPGWVKTDMGGPGASRTAEKGAETAVWLATAAAIPNGKFLRDKEVVKW